MLDFTETQLVELILVAAKRGYKQATEDAAAKAAAGRSRYAQEGIEAYRRQAIALLRKRIGELKDLKANELLITGFNEAAEYLEYGVEKDLDKLNKDSEKPK